MGIATGNRMTLVYDKYTYVHFIGRGFHLTKCGRKYFSLKPIQTAADKADTGGLYNNPV